MNEASVKEYLVNDSELEKRLAEGSIDGNWRLIIKPNWVLRPDKKRILLVEIKERIFEIGSFFKLPPHTAIMLAMLDGEKTLDEIINESVNLFDMSPKDLQNILYSLLINANKAFTLSVEKMVRHDYDLEKFIVPQVEINMTDNRLSAPLSLNLHIADSCMRNCIYCNVHKRATNNETALTTRQLFDVIDQAADMGVLAITLAGGDPFVRNDIPLLIERIFQNKMKCGLSTKAYIAPELAEKLAKTGVEYMQVSIDAPDAELADFLAGSDGFLQDAIGSIKNLRQAGIHVRTNSIITPLNVKMIGNLVKLLVSLGVYEISVTTPSRSLHNGTVSDSLFLNHRDGKWLENEINLLQEQYNDSNTNILPFKYFTDYSWMRKDDREKTFRNRALCSAGRTVFLVLEDGNVVLCEECPIIDELIVGNVKEQTLQEIWDSPKYKESIFPNREKYIGTACYECEEYDDCHSVKGRCWRESLKAFDKLFAPPPLCPNAPIGKRVY